MINYAAWLARYRAARASAIRTTRTLRLAAAVRTLSFVRGECVAQSPRQSLAAALDSLTRKDQIVGGGGWRANFIWTTSIGSLARSLAFQMALLITCWRATSNSLRTTCSARAFACACCGQLASSLACGQFWRCLEMPRARRQARLSRASLCVVLAATAASACWPRANSPQGLRARLEPAKVAQIVARDLLEARRRAESPFGKLAGWPNGQPASELAN